MQKAWYIVEAYCLLTINHILQKVRQAIDDPVLLAILFSHLAFVFTTALLTFRGSRIASRLLAAFIVIGVLYYFWAQIIFAPGFDIYTAYMLLVQAYLLIGAIKLWRIKELPTRFTDPPTEEPAHH